MRNQPCTRKSSGRKLKRRVLCKLKFKFLEIFLSVLGKRKSSVLNFNFEAFRQGLNWA
jgi:hypothetical protein